MTELDELMIRKASRAAVITGVVLMTVMIISGIVFGRAKRAYNLKHPPTYIETYTKAPRTTIVVSGVSYIYLTTVTEEDETTAQLNERPRERVWKTDRESQNKNSTAISTTESSEQNTTTKEFYSESSSIFETTTFTPETAVNLYIEEDSTIVKTEVESSTFKN